MPSLEKTVTIKNVERSEVERVVRDYRALGAEIREIPQFDNKVTLEIRINPMARYLASGSAVLPPLSARP